MSAMPVNISASVGRGGVNNRDDVLKVQRLINVKLPIPLLPLPENGVCGDLTIGAIEEIQRRELRMASPDGRVDPNGATFGFLTGRSKNKPPSTGGRKYTDNPNEVVTKQTKPSAREVVSMLQQAWSDLTETGARTLTSQFMAETGEGKYCFNWNLGNVKAGANERHMYLHNVWECDSQSGAQTAVAKSNGLAHVATADEISKNGWKCPAATVVYEPPHPQCRFRAYESLSDGAQRWLGHHQKIAQKNPQFLTALNNGDVPAVAKALKHAGYYTASEADYAKAMTREKAKIDRELGAQ
jgi:hypothetical protein